MITWVSRLWWRRYLSRNSRPIVELSQFSGLPPDQQRAELSRRLQALIRYFGTRADALPEWREAARIPDPEELWNAWPALPILTKSMLGSRFHPGEMQKRFSLEGRPGATGGSTGEPVPYFHDTEMLRSTTAAEFFTRLRMGWQPGMPTIIVWGSDRDIGRPMSRKVRLHYRFANEVMLDGFALTPPNLERIREVVEHQRAVSIYGYTSMLELVARHFMDAGWVVPPGRVRSAWNGGEMLFPQQSEQFQKVFGVPIHDRYGGRELGATACQFEAGGPLHVLRPWFFLEVVNDQGKPAPPGEAGRLVCTSTVCRGTPFLRYEIGDMAVYDPPHAGPAGIHSLRHIEGRVSGVIHLPDGRPISSIFWNHLFKEFEEIRQFQVNVRRDGALKILLMGSGFLPHREAALRGILLQFLNTVPFELSWVAKIPRTARGKLLQVVRE